MFIRFQKCGRYKCRAEIIHYIVEDRQKTGTLETKFQAKVLHLRDQVGLSEPRKKHPSGLEGWTHLGLCDGNCNDRGNATGGRHSQ